MKGSDVSGAVTGSEIVAFANLQRLIVGIAYRRACAFVDVRSVNHSFSLLWDKPPFGRPKRNDNSPEGESFIDKSSPFSAATRATAKTASIRLWLDVSIFPHV